MCMKNRLSKMGDKASWMLALLAVCGLTSSCKDEYLWDDQKPEWLNSSIYESLTKDGNYTTYIRLLSDADVNPKNARPLTEVLSRTGSKTVFVANDDAWKKFFEENAQRPESDPWHNATSYENLSVSQKKLLIHTSMLNNAIVMENLASSESSGTAVPERGQYMRRYTDVELTDTIAYLDGNSLPTNYNVGNGENDYWARFRTENGGNGIYMVNDSSLSMMLHFTNEHMKKANVTDEDFAIFMQKPRNTEDVHIYDALLIDKDAVCENGYVNTTEKVLAPLPNLAEMIRTNGKTNIFSHMLDRWSAPFYNRGVTEAYKILMASRGEEWTDSIFTKRYFSDLSWGHQPLKTDPRGQQFRDNASTDVALKFDPGWNGFYAEYRGPQYDMASMFVPNDETLWKYFTEGGGGWQLIQTYYLKSGTKDEISYIAPKNFEELYQQIDQIPISTLRSLINIIMFKSFTGSVPSKMTKLREPVTQEQIFFYEDLDHIVDTKLANNGVLYITDKIYGPADYTSVAAPAYISNTNLVMRWAIYNGSTSATDYMGLNYYAYLKAMQSRFAFFLPSDKGLLYYYDPVSFPSQKSRVISFNYKSATFPIEYKMYAFNPANGEFGQNYNLEKMTNSEITNRLKDILESHTVVLDTVKDLDKDIDQYYLTKNNSAIKVTRENGKIVRVQGGYQIENEEDGIEGSISDANKEAFTEIKGLQSSLVEDEQNMNNGTTYILDAPIMPSARSVYSIMSNNGNNDSEDFGAFYDLCQGDEEIIEKCGLVDEKLTASQKKSEKKKYTIFTDMKGPSLCVQFFSNYQYTVLVPSNDAIAEAIANGLPTWDDIRADYEASLNEDGFVSTMEDSLRLQAKITYLTNFVRYHFADQSVFVDKSTFTSRDYVTASYDNEKGLFCKIEMQRPQADVLQVKDCSEGKWLTVSSEVNNLMARDVECSKTPVNAKTMNGITIDGSSFAVIHQIPGVLNHIKLTNGRHDGTWKTASDAKKYLKEFAIQ